MGLRLLFVGLILLTGCSIGGLNLASTRSIEVTYEDNNTKREVKLQGDIESFVDYPELHKIMEHLSAAKTK